MGALLRAAWKGVRDRIEASVRGAGYDDVTPAHLSLFRHPTLDGTHPGEIAAEMQITKQAVNDLLGDLERLGYIRRDVDPDDRRARLVRLTAAGRRLEDTVRIAAREAERSLARELGEARLRSFRTTLIDAARILNERTD